MAKRYEQADEAVRAAYDEAWSTADDAGMALNGLTNRPLGTSPATLAGAAVVAEAILAIHEAERLLRVEDDHHTAALGAHLRKALIRLQGGAT
jgi:hypothetical protein